MAKTRKVSATKSTSRKRNTAKELPRAKRGGRSTPAVKPGNAEKRKTKASGDVEVTVDRRGKTSRRADEDRRKKSQPVVVEQRKLQRREKVVRRRQIDPTTCERDYTGEEVEFMTALDEYKRDNGRMFPTCSEILEVIRGLGYIKASRYDGAAPANGEFADPPAASQADPVPLGKAECLPPEQSPIASPR